MSRSGSPTSESGNPTSPYHRRLQMVVETIQRHEKLSNNAASALAVQVLHTLDHIPERIR